MLIEWLAQEGQRSGLEGAYPHVFIRKTGKENDRDAMSFRDQPLLQIQPAHSRHLHIGDQARCAAYLPGFQKCLGGVERSNAVTQ